MGLACDFEKAVLRLAKLIGDEDCRLAGALAVGAYGFVRATTDVTRVPMAEVGRRLRGGRVTAQLSRRDVSEGNFSCIRGTLAGVPFDVIPPLLAIDWERGGVAQGPKDLMDAAMLVLLNPETRASALELAKAYDAGPRFRSWLEDPRLAREA